MARGMLHGEPAIAAGLFGGKRANILYKLATFHGTSGKKDCIPPKQTPQSYSSKPLTTLADLQQPCTRMSLALFQQGKLSAACWHFTKKMRELLAMIQ